MISYKRYERLRDMHHLTNSTVAEKAGIDAATLSLWKNGHRPEGPTEIVLEKMASVFNMDYPTFIKLVYTSSEEKEELAFEKSFVYAKDCECGSKARLVIPENATNNDWVAIRDMIDAIIKIGTNVVIAKETEYSVR